MPYTFVGVTPFIEQAAADSGLADLDQINKAKSGWHVKAVVDALGQLPGVVEKAAAGHVPDDAPAQILGRARLVLAGLKAQAAGLEAAVADAARGLGLESDPEPEPKKRAAKK